MLGDSSNGNGALSPAQASQLAAHPAWQRSGFEGLERFIFKFLIGGAEGNGEGPAAGRAGAESVRLKLEASGGLGGVAGLGEGLRPQAAKLCSVPCALRSTLPQERCSAVPPPVLTTRSPLHVLQSPLFVADALLGAAETQLGQELGVARADAASVRLVRSQLAAFRREMEKEGQLQVGVSGVDGWVGEWVGWFMWERVCCQLAAIRRGLE